MVRCWYGSGPLMFSLCAPSSGPSSSSTAMFLERSEGPIPAQDKETAHDFLTYLLQTEGKNFERYFLFAHPSQPAGGEFLSGRVEFPACRLRRMRKYRSKFSPSVCSK